MVDTEDLGKSSCYVLDILEVPVENPTWRDNIRVERAWDCCKYV